MKVLDFVWFEDQALHMIDISLTPEQKAALETRHTNPVAEESVTVLKRCCCAVKGGPSLKLHRHYVKVKPALHGISVITSNALNSSLRVVALPVI